MPGATAHWWIACAASRAGYFPGNTASAIFFGGFMLLTLGGPRAIDAKRARKFGESWEGFAAVTSVARTKTVITTLSGD